MKAKGYNYEVDVTLVDFSDEQMAIDMIRENLTQRSEDFQEERDSIILAEEILRKRGCRGAQQPHPGKRNDLGEDHISSRDIEKFVAKKGEMLTKDRISKIRKITKKIHPDLQKYIECAVNQQLSEEDNISKSTAYELTIIEDMDEQKKLVDLIKKYEYGYKELHVLLPIYNNAPEEIKEKLLNNHLRNGALHRLPHTRNDQPIGSREIAKFLSKNGCVDHTTKISF